jgi:hypothetical protein
MPVLATTITLLCPRENRTVDVKEDCHTCDQFKHVAFRGSLIMYVVCHFGECLSENSIAPVSEESFNILKWDESEGPKLGNLDIAYRDHNQPDPWLHAYNILKVSKTTLKDHYEPEGFTYYYWIYPDKYTDRIFRKRRQQEQQP